jgi:hypothetical protein
LQTSPQTDIVVWVGCVISEEIRSEKAIHEQSYGTLFRKRATEVNTMTEQLRQAFERAQQLPDDAQNALAARILEAIDEQEWDEIVRKPHVRQVLRTLAEEARQQEAAGKTEEGGFA